ncbi:MAG: alkaline phosphatase family protein [Candidatus Bipolaricaulota bacterium]|nr:alkaline phosphatase family protein [Candidatus Bipolaricaulota bacterium]
MNKLAIIGLDCADPRLVFEEFIDDLPTINRLVKHSTYGDMISTIPPITVPAWMCMLTGKDPGELGIYGFRNRADYSYERLKFANSRMLSAPGVWTKLGQRGYRSIMLGIPMTYPPSPLNGHMVTGFLTPNTNAQYTYPGSLKSEIEAWVSDYMVDVPFRTDDKDELLKNIYRMTEKRFQVARHLVAEKQWDFFMMVEMGPDRIHHALWAPHDKTHPKHDPQSPYKNAIHDYYVALDRHIAGLIEQLPAETTIVIISDHGIQPMQGGICVNEWLIKKGYLSLTEYPSTPVRVEKLIQAGKVNWKRTKAWGIGGYYGRIFLNIKGREPAGTIRPRKVNVFRDKLIEELSAIPDEHGHSIGTVVYKPADVYKTVNGIPPDLITYFGNLSWRSLGSVGSGKIWAHENDIGPDDANHHPHGMWIWGGANKYPMKKDISIYNVSPKILSHFGI